jgi:hypothetical protein
LDDYYSFLQSLDKVEFNTYWEVVDIADYAVGILGVKNPRPKQLDMFENMMSDVRGDYRVRGC